MPSTADIQAGLAEILEEVAGVAPAAGAKRLEPATRWCDVFPGSLEHRLVGERRSAVPSRASAGSW